MTNEQAEAVVPVDEYPSARLSPDLIAKFWSHVNRRGRDDCWPWIGVTNDKGYGMLSVHRATHLSLQIDGRERTARCALHSCDNPPCVNPNHLRWGTDKDNVADMVERKRHQANRKTECVNGHPLSGDNLIIRANGHRTCRECQRSHLAAHKARKREERLNGKYKEIRIAAFEEAAKLVETWDGPRCSASALRGVLATTIRALGANNANG